MILELLLTLAVICFLLYKLSVRNFDYWEKRKVPYIKPVPFFGNFWDVLTLKITHFKYMEKLCNHFQGSYFGVYILNTPLLIIKDPFLIKQIFENNFNHFYNRNSLSGGSYDPIISKMLPIIHHPEWKTARLQMYPFFSKKHLKVMLELIDRIAADMMDYIHQNGHRGVFEAKDLCSKYTTDVISECVMGLKANSFRDGHAELRKAGRMIFSFGPKNAVRQLVCFLMPNLARLFKLSFVDPGISKFFRNVVSATLEERKASNAKRNDLIDVMISKTTDKDSVIAQTIITFVAGFETSSSIMGFALYELCMHPDIQAKLRQEIKLVVSQDAKLSYETIHNIKYLDMVVLETLRKYPPGAHIDRTCTTEYKLPNSDLTIEKGQVVMYPVYAMNHDPEYFPDPEKFDPNRFLEDNGNLFGSVFLPFGLGPRDCIGKRFALTSMKTGLVRILLKYELLKCPETPTAISFETKSFMLAPTTGLHIKFIELP